MCKTAGTFGIGLTTHRAQQFDYAHLEEFDHIFVMDKSNLHDVLYLDRKDKFGSKVRLFREFDPQPEDYQVPDPYYGGPAGFENVYHIVNRTSRKILERLIDEYGLAATLHSDAA
jgi:protein-tyrosine phosphatase